MRLGRRLPVGKQHGAEGGDVLGPPRWTAAPSSSTAWSPSSSRPTGRRHP